MNSLLCSQIFGAFMRPLEPPKKPKHKPLLQRMAEDKAAQREHGSQTGSGFFTVQLPDGTYEKRPKTAANPDPGVHSNLKLDEVLCLCLFARQEQSH